MRELRGQTGLWDAPRALPAEAPRDGRRERIQEVIDTQILPRLLRAHPRLLVTPAEIDAFARQLIAPSDGPALSAFEALAARGGEAAALDLIGAAALRLGDFWCEDDCDFFAVEQGCARLRAMLAQRQTPEGVGPEGRPSMLMLTLPGETHKLGADLAAEAFRREGWHVQRADGDLAALDAQRFDAVGVSCGGERAAAGLPDFLAGARARAAHADTAFLVGGPYFISHPEKARGLGVDFVAEEPGATRRISLALLERRTASARTDRFPQT